MLRGPYGRSPPLAARRGARPPAAAGGRGGRGETARGVPAIPPDDPGHAARAVLPSGVPRPGAPGPRGDGASPSPPGLVPARGRPPEARHAVPVVGMGRRGPVRGVLDPRVEPDPGAGRNPGARVHPPV